MQQPILFYCTLIKTQDVDEKKKCGEKKKILQLMVYEGKVWRRMHDLKVYISF